MRMNKYRVQFADAPAEAQEWTECNRDCDCVGECKAGLERPPAEVQAQGDVGCTCHYLPPRDCPHPPHRAEPDTRPSAPVGVEVRQALRALTLKYQRHIDAAHFPHDFWRDLEAALAQQPAAVDDEGNRDTWRALWLVLRQTGTVAVPRHDIVSADWSRCQVEQTEHEMTGTVRLRAILLAAQPGGSDNDR